MGARFSCSVGDEGAEEVDCLDLLPGPVALPGSQANRPSVFGTLKTIFAATRITNFRVRRHISLEARVEFAP